MNDFVDLMDPEESARLRHSLRTPLNHIIGYAEMLREYAEEQSAAAEAELMQEVVDAAHRIAAMVQEALPVKSHVAPGAIPRLRAGMRSSIERIASAAVSFEKVSGKAFPGELDKIRMAARELHEFALDAGPSAAPPPFQAPEAPSPAQELPSARAEFPPPSAGGRILVVDDDAGNREILQRRLAREGFEAVAEAGGEAALARLRRESFDLVLLDIFMPGMDGFEMLARMKASPELHAIPVIVLSAVDDQEKIVRSIEMGADDFVAKPFDPVVLRARIGAILRRRRAETERAEMSERLASLLESSGEGIYGMDRNVTCTFVNRAALEMLGHSRESLLGSNPHDVLHHSRPDGSPYPAADCPILAVLRTGEPCRRREEVLFRADGSSFPVELSASPIHRGGETDGVVVTFADISERKHRQEHLLESAKLESVGVLAGGIAHDFNNILTGILGNASLVLDTLPPRHPNRELLDDVVKAGERAAHLTRQMLAFAGKGQLVLEPVDLSRAIQDIAELLGSSLPKTAEFRLKLATGLPRVDADARQIQQMVFNLVSNAGEAIGDRAGIVTVTTAAKELAQPLEAEAPFRHVAPGSYVYLSVEDNGSGIEPAVRKRIFDPFFSTRFAGRGLGLPAVLGIVGSHRGAIRLESEPGSGSCFEVWLPVKPEARGDARPWLMPPAETAARAGGRTVLVVDDEEIVRNTTRAMLERKGFRVLLAANGQEAVAIFRERAADIALVLMDLTMPVMGGEEAVRYLRAIRHDVPILVASGYPESEVARRFTGSRVKGYVRKPYTAAGLLQQVGAALA